ncbi:MAG: EamA family transporter [Chloroflexi bacterium]|nr:DMT family transporter [Chloroflexi bacterium CFX1]MCK6566290.1 DMT family transporter [Anaerolineales bacterium]MCQ3952702.1 EamA family transporter [Chloroflexota bacterium]MDL1917951.1 DMT family transporter [Chloroflexi bacterium CFX5]NUQ59299.1 DMT family transporter [Anaerolineales bacterium]
MRKHHTFTGLLSGLVAASIWGGMYVVSKVVLEVIPPFTLLLMRLLMGAATLGVAIVFINRKADKNAALSKETFWRSVLIGLVGYGISLGFQFVGTKLSTASNGALVTSATPAFVLLFAPILLGEKTTARRIVALVLSSLGVLAVIDPRNAELSPSLFWGNISLLAAALTWALYSVLVRKLSQSGDLLVFSAIMLLGGVPFSIPLSIWELSTVGVGAITPAIVGGLLFLGIVATAVGMFLWNYAFAQLPAAVASLTFFAQPVVGTLLGWFFLSEEITPLFLVGGALIGIGILIATRD